MRADGTFEIGQPLKDFLCSLAALRRQCDDERSPISLPNLTRHQAPVDETVDDARQRGAFMRQSLVQICHRRGAGRREDREDVRFALRQRTVAEARQVQSDSVRRAMNWRNQTEHAGASRR